MRVVMLKPKEILCFVLFLGGAFFLSHRAMAEGETTASFVGTSGRTLSLRVHAERKAVSDTAQFSARVVTRRGSVKEALGENSKTVSVIRDFFLKEGVEKTNFQAAQPSFSVAYDYDQSGKAKKVGYDVTQVLSVSMKDLAKAGEWFDKVTSFGENVFPEITFSVKNSESLRDLARQDAVSEAQRRALLYAQASHTKLGKLLSLSEVGASNVSPPIAYAMKAADGTSPSITPAELSFDVEISVVWEILE